MIYKMPIMEKVLVRGPNWIGDVVMSLPFFEGMKDAWPDADIYVLTKPYLKDIYLYNPYIKGVITLDEDHGLWGWSTSLREIRKLGFGRGICLPHSVSSALFLWLACIPKRYGRACQHRSIFLTHPVAGTIEDFNGHQMDFYMELLDALAGFNGRDLLPKIYLSDKEQKKAHDIINGIERPILGLFASAAYGPAKMWPGRYFIDLANFYIQATGGSVILFGATSDMNTNDHIATSIGSKAYNLAGKTSLLETAGVMCLCDVIAANDSGPMHMAAATGVKTIGIFGSSDPKRTAPRGERAHYIYKGLKCSPCMERQCRYGTYDCLKVITPEEVLSKMIE